MSHFIPTAFDAGAGALIAGPLDGLARPVTTDAPLIETVVIESKAGTLVTFQNWSGKPVKGMKVTVNLPARKKATLASGGKVEVDGAVYKLDLDVADALILR